MLSEYKTKCNENPKTARFIHLRFFFRWKFSWMQRSLHAAPSAFLRTFVKEVSRVYQANKKEIHELCLERKVTTMRSLVLLLAVWLVVNVRGHAGMGDIYLFWC